MIKVTLLDKGIKDLANLVRQARSIYKKKYKSKWKMDSKKVPLEIWVKRGPIMMKKGEWAKDPASVQNLTLNDVDVIKAFDKKNLNWGVLGYGDPKGGLKELLKFAKRKLDPKQVKGIAQDLNMEFSKPDFKKLSNKCLIIVTVPDKSLGGGDIESPILEKNGFLGLNKFIEEAKKLLNKDEKLDRSILEILEKKKNLKDLMLENDSDGDGDVDEEDKAEMEDSAYRPTSLRGKVREIMQELYQGGYLDINSVYEALDNEHVMYNKKKVNSLFEEIYDEVATEGEIY